MRKPNGGRKERSLSKDLWINPPSNIHAPEGNRTWGSDGRSSLPHAPPLCFLLADDFEQWRIKVREMVESRSGWEILSEACDGQQALEKAQQFLPDVVLLDIQMPVMNGLQAAREIRKVSPSSKIIFVTCTSDATVRRVALEIADGYILKDNVLKELVPTVTACLSHNGSREGNQKE